MIFARTLIATVAAAGAFGAHAQQDPVYRGLDAKGQTVYSSSPKGLRDARKVQLAEPAISSGVSAPAPAAPAPATASGAGLGAASPAAPAPARGEGAQARLAAAQRAHEAGDEPLPGERLGTATGGSRLAPAYFERRAREAKELAEALEASGR